MRRLRDFRSRHMLGYYASWAIAVSVGAVAVVIPQAIAERDWMALLIALVLGIGGGLGLGVAAQQFRGERWW